MVLDEAGVRDVKKILQLFQWSLKVAIFFTLFAFALNNPGDVTLHFFFGTQWTGPLVLMVLGVFTLGLITGVLGMLPKWWRHRKALKNIQDVHATHQHSSQHAKAPLLAPLSETTSSAKLYPRPSDPGSPTGAPHGV
jgi:uncharacterized integral membrane protein